MATERITINDLRERTTLSIPEAAQVLGISRPQAYKLAKTGQLPSVSVGSRVVVSAPLLLALISTPQN